MVGNHHFHPCKTIGCLGFFWAVWKQRTIKTQEIRAANHQIHQQKTLQDLQNNISKHFQIKRNSFQHIYISQIRKNLPFEKKIPFFNQKKQTGKILVFMGDKDWFLHFRSTSYRVFRCSKVLQLLKSSALHGQSPRPPACHRCLGGTAPWHLDTWDHPVDGGFSGDRSLTPMKISPFKHRAIWKGNNQPQVLGDLRFFMVVKHLLSGI